jgi:hypothetical protein
MAPQVQREQEAPMSSAEHTDPSLSGANSEPKEAPDKSSSEQGAKKESPETSARNRFRNQKVAAGDESSLYAIGVRDVAVFSVVLAIFGGAESWARTTNLGLAQFVVVFIGLVGGAALAALGHEWGHLAGARLGGGHAPTKPFKAFPQVFDFDYQNNSPKSFLWMSIGGNLGNWAMALFFALALSLESIGADALVAGAVGFSVFSALVEFPVIQRARAGMPGLESLLKIPKDFTTRYIPHALTAAFLTFIII